MTDEIVDTARMYDREQFLKLMGQDVADQAYSILWRLHACTFKTPADYNDSQFGDRCVHQIPVRIPCAGCMTSDLVLLHRLFDPLQGSARAMWKKLLLDAAARGSDVEDRYRRDALYSCAMDLAVGEAREWAASLDEPPALPMAKMSDVHVSFEGESPLQTRQIRMADLTRGHLVRWEHDLCSVRDIAFGPHRIHLYGETRTMQTEHDQVDVGLADGNGIRAQAHDMVSVVDIAQVICIAQQDTQIFSCAQCEAQDWKFPKEAKLVVVATDGNQRIVVSD